MNLTRQRWTGLLEVQPRVCTTAQRPILLGLAHSALHSARTSPSLAPLALRMELEEPYIVYPCISNSRVWQSTTGWAEPSRPVSMASLSRVGQDLSTLGAQGNTASPSVHSSYQGTSLRLSSFFSLDSPPPHPFSSAGSSILVPSFIQTSHRVGRTLMVSSI